MDQTSSNENNDSQEVESESGLLKSRFLESKFHIVIPYDLYDIYNNKVTFINILL